MVQIHSPRPLPSGPETSATYITLKSEERLVRNQEFDSSNRLVPTNTPPLESASYAALPLRPKRLIWVQQVQHRDLEATFKSKLTCLATSFLYLTPLDKIP